MKQLIFVGCRTLGRFCRFWLPLDPLECPSLPSGADVNRPHLSAALHVSGCSSHVALLGAGRRSASIEPRGLDLGTSPTTSEPTTEERYPNAPLGPLTVWEVNL